MFNSESSSLQQESWIGLSYIVPLFRLLVQYLLLWIDQEYHHVSNLIRRKSRFIIRTHIRKVHPNWEKAKSLTQIYSTLRFQVTTQDSECTHWHLLYLKIFFSFIIFIIKLTTAEIQSITNWFVFRK